MNELQNFIKYLFYYTDISRQVYIIIYFILYIYIIYFKIFIKYYLCQIKSDIICIIKYIFYILLLIYTVSVYKIQFFLSHSSPNSCHLIFYNINKACLCPWADRQPDLLMCWLRKHSVYMYILWKQILKYIFLIIILMFKNV